MVKLLGKIVVVGLLMVGALQAQSVDINLSSGWNLVGTPVYKSINDYSIFGNHRAIYTYSNAEASYSYYPDAIPYGAGYWLYVVDNKIITFEGIGFDPQTDFEELANGWHLLSTGIVLGNLTEQYNFKRTWVWRNQEWVRDPNIIYPGEGFFINKDENFALPEETEGEVTTVITIDTDPVVQFQPLSENSTELNSSLVAISENNSTNLDISKSIQEAQQDLEKNLFIDGVFQGVVAAINDNGDGTVNYELKKAENIEDVFKNFNIQVSNDEIIRSLSRQLPKSIGRYDYLNSQPLNYSFHERSVITRSGQKTKQLTLRIEFPEGYYMPIQPRGIDLELDCDLDVWELSGSCEGSAGASVNYESKPVDLDFSASWEPDGYGIEFSTSESFIEIGIGANAGASYNGYGECDAGVDWECSNETWYEMNYAANAYFKSQLTFKIHGELEKSWETELKPINDFDVDIRLYPPYDEIAHLTLAFYPRINVGVSGKLEGLAMAQASIFRKGEVSFEYSSRVGEDGSVQDMTETDPEYTTTAIDQAGINLEAKLEADAYVFPNLAVSPEIEFFQIESRISMVKLRAGAKVNAGLDGEFNTGMQVINGEYSSHLDAEACANLDLIPSIDYKFQFAFGDTNIYPKKNVDYSTLYSHTFQILEWCMKLLNTPEIQTAVDDDGLTWVNFDIEADADTKEYIKYIYTLDGGKPTVNNDTWDGNPFILSETSTVKVYAYLENNSDISDSVWSFGTSYSLVAEKEVEAQALVTTLEAPNISVGTNSDGSVDVSFSISTEEAIMPYMQYVYTTNGSDPKQSGTTWSGSPIRLTTDTTVKVYAKYNGASVYGVNSGVGMVESSTVEKFVEANLYITELNDPVILVESNSDGSADVTFAIEADLSLTSSIRLIYTADDSDPRQGGITWDGSAIHFTDDAVVKVYAMFDGNEVYGSASNVGVVNSGVSEQEIKALGSSSGGSGVIEPD